MQRAIVTGATGFVGSHLCKQLINSDWKVSIISRKTSDYTSIESIKDQVDVLEYDGDIESLIKFFKETKADVVFHLASVSVVEHKTNQINSLVESNIKFGLHIIEAMKESKTELLINTGSYWQHYNSDSYNPVNLYAATKQAFEDLLKYYSEVENIRTITLKLFDTYGESDKRPKLINLLHKFSYEKQQLNMSPGEQLLDLVHVDDVVSAYVRAFDYLKDNELVKFDEFAVATGRQVKLKDLVDIFEEVTSKKINVCWGGKDYRKREVMKPWVDYKTLPNWQYNVTLEEGLKRYKGNILEY